MIRVRRNPLWLVLILSPFAAWLWFAYPAERTWLGICLIGLSIMVVIQVGFWLLNVINPPPVPSTAVRQLLDCCARQGEDEEWILVEFRPRVSLEEARQRAGSPTYSKQDRLHGFMTKFQWSAPSRPDVALFFSPEKGYLMGRVRYINALEQNYGRWTLDTWYSMTGAMVRMGMQPCCLDGGQMFVRGQHIGSS